ncbi:class II aldolase/adducin family protein [Aestuariirhabdus litorea]|uniref:Class II aldolase/adducin family protein n=1 Tax=Aestuariirhabdus litorea TaxID=2528527 RepID=A0A3P3VQX2_9GAMM|nr:class II aldolase/adducin family protein [Aestuariirhabdus litorea]RRJ84066.1 class II aldolase/adducin family protein [Aestuariirhabdus litorea]RWW97286.1 class II aldolase/adducin family protein [Endozoicomonadaceae bacterium GTF-13]
MEREGVVKYQDHHRPTPLAIDCSLEALNHCRRRMLTLGMIGQSPSRYGGLGFGNISQRLAPGEDAFLISGTQTGHLAELDADSLALVERAEPELNRLWSQGYCAPSSEALSHAVIYQQRPECNAVIHVHCPLIWQRAQALALPCTAPQIPYGTPAMARAIAEQLTAGTGVIAMLGHEDGVISYGSSLTEAAEALVRLQAHARELAGENSQ